MKLELKENMYIRTKYGIIDKILKLNKSYVKGVSQKDELYVYDIDNIVKASYNIIDILEEGDYVNGRKVVDIFYDANDNVMNICVLGSIVYDNNEIKSIVTKEMFKNAEYRMALLSNTTFEFLVKYISDNRKSLMNSEYLFTKLTGKNKGEPLDADSVYSMLKRLSKKTDINSHPHQ